MRTALLLLTIFALGIAAPSRAQDALPADTNPARPLAELQRDLVNLRFGMFVCASPVTYLDLPDHFQPDHAPPRQGKDEIAGTPDDLPPTLFNPVKLDCGQWADAATGGCHQHPHHGTARLSDPVSTQRLRPIHANCLHRRNCDWSG